MGSAMQSATIVMEKATWPKIVPAMARARAKAKVARVARVSMGPREMEKDGQQKEDGQRKAARERKGKEKGTKAKCIKAHV